MLYLDRGVFRRLLLLLDLCALIAAFHLAARARIGLNGFYRFQMTPGVMDLLVPPLGLILLLWIPMSAWLTLYRPRRGGVLAGSLAQVAESVAALAILTIVVTFFIRDFGTGFSRSFVLFFSAIGMVTLMAARLVLWRLVRAFQGHGFAHERVAIVGSGADTKTLVEHLEAAGHPGVSICGVITVAGGAGSGMLGNPVPVIGTLDDVGGLINTHRIDRIIAVVSEMDRISVQSLAAICTRMGVTLNRLPVHSELQQASRVRVYEMGDLSLLEVRGLQFTPAQEFVKRLFDLTVGSLLLAASLPVVAVLAVLVRLTSRGPVLYVAPRVGKGGRHFPFYKLRTMVPGADTMKPALAGRNEQAGHLFKIKDDPRLTPVGRLMRRYSLDELPQLVNVLKGDMSLVGPRPLPAGDLPPDGLSRDHAFWAMERTRVLPGITGLWQVRGRNDLGFEEMIRHDIAYARNWSVWQDVRILAQTLPAVMRGRGAC